MNHAGATRAAFCRGMAGAAAILIGLSLLVAKSDVDRSHASLSRSRVAAATDEASVRSGGTQHHTRAVRRQLPGDVEVAETGTSSLIQPIGTSPVSAASAAWSLTASPNPVAPGASVTYTVTPPGAGLYFQPVTVTYGGQTLCTASVLLVAGRCTAPAPATGVDLITARYEGATVASNTVVVSAGGWSLTANPGTVTAAQGVTTTFTLTSITDPGVTTATLEIGSQQLCTIAIDNATSSTCTVSAAGLPVGSDAVLAAVGEAPTSTVVATATLTVAAPWTVTASPSTSTFNQTLNLTATAPAGTNTALESVTFTVGSMTLCSTLVLFGDATCSTSAAPIGADTINARVGSLLSTTQSPIVGATTLIVVPQPLVISTATLPQATLGTAYSATVAASGGDVPLRWSIASGSLPTGLILSATTGAISGTPTVLGHAAFTVKLTDSYTPIEAVSEPFTIAVMPPPLTITSPATLPPGKVATPAVPYSTQLTAAGGVAPYAWAITAGSLPAGLTLASNGYISGTPAAFGITTFTLTLTDSCPANVCLAPEVISRPESLEITGPAQIPTFIGSSYNPGGSLVLEYRDNTDGEANYVLQRVASGTTIYGTYPPVSGIGGTIIMKDTAPVQGATSQTDCYTVTAKMPDGTTATSAPFCNTYTLPAPTSLRVTARTATSLTVAFTLPATAVSWGVRAGGVTVRGLGGGSVTATINGLQSHTAYIVQAEGAFESSDTGGPIATLSTQTLCVVPNIVNDTISQARAAIRAAGLTVPPSANYGWVNTQTPTAGSLANPGATVNFTFTPAWSSITLEYSDTQTGDDVNVFLVDETTGTCTQEDDLSYNPYEPESDKITFPANHHSYAIYAYDEEQQVTCTTGYASTPLFYSGKTPIVSETDAPGLPETQI